MAVIYNADVERRNHERRIKEYKKREWNTRFSVYSANDISKGMRWSTDKFKYLVCYTYWERPSSGFYQILHAVYVRESKRTGKRELRRGSTQSFMNHKIETHDKIWYWCDTKSNWIWKKCDMHEWYEEEVMWQEIK